VSGASTLGPEGPPEEPAFWLPGLVEPVEELPVGVPEEEDEKMAFFKDGEKFTAAATKHPTMKRKITAFPNGVGPKSWFMRKYLLGWFHPDMGNIFAGKIVFSLR